MNDPMTFIEYSKNILDVYKNIEEPQQTMQYINIFHDLIPKMISKEKPSTIVIELFTREN